MFSRRRLFSSLLGTALAQRIERKLDRNFGEAASIFKIAFGSCVSQRRDQKIWQAISAKSPDLFVMMGDGIYPEHEGPDLEILDSIERAYEFAKNRQELSDFRSQVDTIAIWDDNDYGGSDIGASFAHKCRSRDLFLDFWATPEESTQRRRSDGIYGSWEFGPENQRIQILVPDLRFCRTEWAQTEAAVRKKLGENGFGPYKPDLSADAKMLGEEQWAWLGTCLGRPAALRVLVSSIQLVPEGRGWESWSNFPHEKTRLLSLIRESGAEGLVVISGDTHYGEVSVDSHSAIGYPLWEFTSSGLTECWPSPGPNPNRIGEAYPVTNFGLLTINWAHRRPMLVAELYSETGVRLRQSALFLDELVLSQIAR